MKKLSINPVVLQALQQAFPKPANSAEKGLKKYVALLEQLVNASAIYVRPAYEDKMGWYTLSKNALMHKGGQIGKDKIRLQKWLEQNNLALIECVVEGNYKSGQLSQVKLTNLVTVEEVMPDIYNLTQSRTTEERSQSEDLFSQLFGDMLEMDDAEINANFDFVDVNVKSVAGYYEWLKSLKTPYNRDKWKCACYQAEQVLNITAVTDGLLPQRKKLSPFGRTYYSGTNVQTVNRELRRAMLGNCWEYDLKSSVFSWKMAFTRDCHQPYAADIDYRALFSMSLYYLESKKQMLAELRSDVFGAESATSRDRQNELLKQVFTAIGFGAKATSAGWYDPVEGRKSSAIASIVKNADERKRLLGNWMVQKFMKEQKMLDNYIYALAQHERLEFMETDASKNKAGGKSKSKVLAYLYQQTETNIMDMVVEVLQNKGYTVLAHVHDAIFVRQKVSDAVRAELNFAMQDAIGSEYVRFGEEELRAYAPPSAHAREQEQLHRQKIAEEDRKAKLRVANDSGNWVRDEMGSSLTLFDEATV